MGEQSFTFVLRPHGSELSHSELFTIAKKVNGGYEYLVDSVHTGRDKQKVYSLALTDASNVEIMLIKKAEDDNDYVVRLLELQGKDSLFTLSFLGEKYNLSIGHNEIKTVKINPLENSIKEVNLIEWQE